MIRKQHILPVTFRPRIRYRINCFVLLVVIIRLSFHCESSRSRLTTGLGNRERNTDGERWKTPTQIPSPSWPHFRASAFLSAAFFRGGGNKKVFKTFQRLAEPSSGNILLLLSHVLLQCFRERPFAISGHPFYLDDGIGREQNKAERSLGDAAPQSVHQLCTPLSVAHHVQRASVALELGPRINQM